MSKTQENLLKAFAGESMARNKYTFFAKQARKEGLEWIARVFEETADNERAHAEEEFENIKGEAKMTNSYNIHQIGSTIENLKAAAVGEKFETEVMYPDFANIADKDGKAEITNLLKEIAEVEAKHQKRYEELASALESGNLYKREEEIEWRCLNCGYIHKGKEAPSPNCPLCKKPRGWYMPINRVY